VKVVLDSGEVLDLGETEATPTIGIVDYSRRVTDDYGVTTVVERGFVRRMSVNLVVPFDQTDALQRNLAAIRAKPARWIADEGVDWLDFRGFYKDFEVNLPVPPKAYCTLTVEALTATEAFADPGGDPAPVGSASTLQLLQPVTIVGGALVASTVPENDYPEWAAGTTYPLGARVIKAATHRIYESGAIGNVGNDPAGTSGKWQDIGPTNRWAMFDQALGSTTEAPGQITVSVAPGAANAVALLDVKAATVRVVTTGYDRTLVPNASGTVTFLDLPGTDGQITAVITGPDTVEVGTLLVGKLVGLGSTTEDAKAGITDFSRKEADEFGEIQIVERAWAKRMTLPAKIRRDAIDLVAGRIAAVRAKPSLWIGKEGMETLTVYGFFKDFSIAVDTTICTLSLSIEGLSTAGKVEPLAASVDWPDVGDPAGTKPEDNATVGAPAGTDVAGKPAEEVVGQLEEQELALDQLDLDVAQATINIAAAQATIAQMQTEAVATKAELEADIASLNATADQIQTDAAGTRAALATAQADILAAGGRIDSVESTLGDQGASITSLSQTVSNHTGRLASIDTTLSANGASINQNAQAISAVQGDLASLSSTVATQGASIAQNAQAISTANQNIASLSTTVSAHTASISQNAQAIASLDTNLATLTTRVAAAGTNLLPNGGLENGFNSGIQATGGFVLSISPEWGPYAYTTADGFHLFAFASLIGPQVGARYTFAIDALAYGSSDIACDMVCVNQSGNELAASNRTVMPGQFNFSNDDNRRAMSACTILVPNGTAQLVCRILGTVRNGQIIGFRRAKLESGTQWSRYSAEAGIVQQFQAISGLTGQYASLSTTVSTHDGSITTLQQSMTSAQGSISSLESRVTTINANVGQNASAISAVNQSVASLSTTVTSQGAAIATAQQAITNLNSSTATLTTVLTAGSNPNLVKNAGFETGNLQNWSAAGMTFGVGASGGWGVVAAGYSDIPDNSYAFLDSDAFPVFGNAWYTATADSVLRVSGGAAWSNVQLLFFDGNGGLVGNPQSQFRNADHDFTSDGSSRKVLFASGATPGSAVSAKIRLATYKVSGALTVVGWRLAKVEQGQIATPFSNEASVTQAFQALSSLNTQYASLSSTVSTQGVTVSQNSTAITSLNSNVSSLMGRWGVEIDVNGYVSGVTTNNNGTRADFTIRADKFAIVSPGGGARTEYSNGNWRVYNAAGVLKVQLGVNI